VGEGELTRRTGAEAAVRAYISALNTGDVEAAVDCVSDDFVNQHTATLGESVVGRNAYRERLHAFLAEFHNLRYDIEDMIVDGERVAVPYVMSAIWLGPDPGIGEERPFSIHGMFNFTVVSGRITRRVDYWDSAEFERQVGSAT